MIDPLKDKRVKNCPDCKVVIMMGEVYTFYCGKHIRFGELPPNKVLQRTLRGKRVANPKPSRSRR